MKALVTGANGFIGSHTAERLFKDGFEVRAFTRETGDTSFIGTLGVELFKGDFSDPASLNRALEGVDYIFHCAGMVSDWAKREDMVRVNVDALRSLLDECVKMPVKRFVVVSSLAVLGMAAQENANESAPYVYTGDNYNYTKIASEKVALDYYREKGVPVVIIRAPYVYGPRDRHLLPRVVGALRSGVFRYIDHGKNPISMVSVKNLVDALILAAASPNAVGQVYHITDGRDMTRKEFIETICEVLAMEKPGRSIPAWLASALIPILEGVHRILPTKEPPILNRFRMKFMHTYLTFDISKARRQLGYIPGHSFQNSMKEALQGYKKEKEEENKGNIKKR